MTSAKVSSRDRLLKTDCPRAIDDWINYFGEWPSSPRAPRPGSGVQGSGRGRRSGRARSHAPRLARLAAAGRSGIGHVLLGSVAERVFAKVTAPVMLVRPRAVATTYLEGRQRM